MYIDMKKFPPEKAAANRLVLATGEELDRSDPDELIAAFEKVDRQYRALGDAKKQLALALADLTESSEKRTRRVEGRERRAKIEMPDDYYTTSILLEAWNAFPQHRDRVLRISQLSLKKREWSKLDGTKGPKDLTAFRDLIRRANCGATGTPRVTIEK